MWWTCSSVACPQAAERREPLSRTVCLTHPKPHGSPDASVKQTKANLYSTLFKKMCSLDLILNLRWNSWKQGYIRTGSPFRQNRTCCLPIIGRMMSAICRESLFHLSSFSLWHCCRTRINISSTYTHKHPLFYKQIHECNKSTTFFQTDTETSTKCYLMVLYEA